MPNVKEEEDLIPIMLRNVVPSIPKRKTEMQDLVEDLTRMRCEGLLPKPWNLRNKAILRVFLLERGNKWERTMRIDPEQWTANVWPDVYDFVPRKGRDGRAGRTRTS